MNEKINTLIKFIESKQANVTIGDMSSMINYLNSIKEVEKAEAKPEVEKPKKK